MSVAVSASRLTVPARRTNTTREWRWFLVWCLAPALAVLMIVTLAPTIYLVATSFTPLNLTNPRTAWNFSQPLINYKLLLGDERFHNSLWVQAKLSFWTVSLQMVIGIGFALLLNLRAGMMQALRTVFLIPMVLPPIVVAIIWKVLYTPDISPIYWMAKAVGWHLPTFITDPNWALPAIIVADTWEWFPLTMLMVLAALANRAGGTAGRREGGRGAKLADYAVRHYSLYSRHFDGRGVVPADQFHQGLSADLSADRWRPGIGDGGHELLCVRAGV